MGSKLGTILSLFFFALALFMGTDFLRIQFLHSELDAFSLSIGDQIAFTGKITDSMREMAKDRYNATINQLTSGTPRVGDFLEYEVSASYTPVVISNRVMTVTITRMVLIGYMD